MEYKSESETMLRSKVAAGYKGGSFFSNPIKHPSMTIVDGVKPEVKQAMMSKAVPMQSVEDPWYSRRR